QVALWLKKIYGDQPIPEYEVNERTVDILTDVMERNEGRDRDVSLLIEGIKHQAKEYEEQMKEMKEILSGNLGLCPTSLSRRGKKVLRELTKNAMTLEAEDTSLTSFFCAINKRSEELFETKSANREMQQKVNIEKKKLSSVLLLERQLQQDIKEIEEFQAKQTAREKIYSNNLHFLRAKSVELKIRIKAVEEELIARGLSKALTHEALLKLSEEVAAAQKNLMPLKKEQKSYHDLPPVITYSTVLL
ncbi:HAUS1 protein, partial [Serilophus lunatus]|nr:HAUS1 protein [Serilophus lunatus]